MKTTIVVFSAVVATMLALGSGCFFALRASVSPLHGEWSVPLRLGFIEVHAGVPSLLRLATSSWAGPLLDGRSLATRHGTMRLAWDASQRMLGIRCAPCTVEIPGLGQKALELADVQATVHRLGEQLSGELGFGQVHGQWQGELTRGGIRLRLSIPQTQLAEAYAVVAADVPEVRHARIGGTFSLQAQLSLPDGKLTFTPRVEGFEVSGLGTEALVGARSACARRAGRLTPEHWLARAVVAAEDQRFFDHPGYDLMEISASFARNAQQQRVERGGSTLTQQLAKLLFIGDERSPVRKLREVLYAVEMERTLGKARILHLYLDNAPWGMGSLCGAEAAAIHYFGVHAHELLPGQAAWLAAMLRNPAAEAQRWAETGHVDMARAQWVALAMRGMTRQKKLQLADDMAAMDWPPLWAEPGERDGSRP